MKVVYQTEDGKIHSKFDQAQSHEIEMVENNLGSLMDNKLEVTEGSIIKRKLNFMKFLLDNHGYIILQLTKYRDALDSDEDELLGN